MKQQTKDCFAQIGYALTSHRLVFKIGDWTKTRYSLSEDLHVCKRNSLADLNVKRALRPTTNVPPRHRKKQCIYLYLYLIFILIMSRPFFLYFSQHSLCFTVFSVCCQSLAAVLYLIYLFEVFQVLVHSVSHFFLSYCTVVNILLFRT